LGSVYRAESGRRRTIGDASLIPHRGNGGVALIIDYGHRHRRLIGDTLQAVKDNRVSLTHLRNRASPDSDAHCRL
jgi:SAM-dependent MidA family methyltransferase